MRKALNLYEIWKYWSWKVTGRIYKQKFFRRTILDKQYGIIQKSQATVDSRRKLCLKFDRYHKSFIPGRKWNVDMTMIVWEFFICSLRLYWWFKFLNKVPSLMKKGSSIRKKTPQTKVLSFSIKFINVNQRQERVFTENCSIQNFSASVTFYICIYVLSNALKLYERSKYWSVKETGMRFRENFFLADNAEQKNLE